MDKFLDAPKELVKLASTTRQNDAILHRLLTADDMKPEWKGLYKDGMTDSKQTENANNERWRVLAHARGAHVLPINFDYTPTGLDQYMRTIIEWYRTKRLPSKREIDAAKERIRGKLEDVLSDITENEFELIPYTLPGNGTKQQTYITNLVKDWLSVLSNPKTFFRISPLTNKGGTKKGAPTFFAVMLDLYMRQYCGGPRNSRVAAITNTIIYPKRITGKDVETFVYSYKQLLSGKSRKKSSSKSRKKSSQKKP